MAAETTIIRVNASGSPSFFVKFNMRSLLFYTVVRKDQVEGMLTILSPSLNPSRQGREAGLLPLVGDLPLAWTGEAGWG